jgi:hypothetical protein
MKGLNVRLRNKSTPRWSGGLLMCGAVLACAALLLTAAPGTAFAAVKPGVRGGSPQSSAVPSRQTASASSSVSWSSTGATDAAPAVGSAPAAPAQNAPSFPAVTPGEVKAAQATLPACGCPPNAGEVKYALKELGVKSLSLNLLIKRLGKQVGTDAFVVLAASLSKKAATVRKLIPFPDYKSKTATKYAKSPYRVYEIYGTSLGPGYYHWTWKYGITRQLIPAQRPQRQLAACTKYYGSQHLLDGSCTFDWLWIGVGWLQARTIEASYTLLYAITHQGNCPPGMPACV